MSDDPGRASPATKLDRIAQHADEARKACQAMASHLATFVDVARSLGKRLDGLEDFNGDLVSGLETAFGAIGPSMAKQWADYWVQLERFRQDEKAPPAEPVVLHAQPDLEPVTMSEPAMEIVPVTEPCDKCGVLRLKGQECKEGCDLGAINLRSLPKWQRFDGEECDTCGVKPEGLTRCLTCGIERRNGALVPIEKETAVEVKEAPMRDWVLCPCCASVECKLSHPPVEPPAFAGTDDVNATRARLLGAHGHEPEALLTALWEKGWQAGWESKRTDGAPLREGTAQGAVDRALNALSPYLRVEAQAPNSGDYWKARNVLAHLVSGSFEEGEAPSDWVPMVTKAVDSAKNYARVSNGLLHVDQPNFALMLRAIVIDAFNAGARSKGPAATMQERQQVFAEGEAQGARIRGEEAMAQIETMAKRHQDELTAQDRQAFGRGWLAAAARLRQVGVQMMAHVPSPDWVDGSAEQE